MKTGLFAARISFSPVLNGLIYHLRGKDDSAPELALERRVNNNTVLKNCVSLFH